MKFTLWTLTGFIVLRFGMNIAAPLSTRESDVTTENTGTKITKCLREQIKLLTKPQNYILAVDPAEQVALQSNDAVNRRIASAPLTNVVVLPIPSSRGQSENTPIDRRRKVQENSIKTFLDSSSDYEWVSSCLNGEDCKNTSGDNLNMNRDNMDVGSQVAQVGRPAVSSTNYGAYAESLSHDTTPKPEIIDGEQVSLDNSRIFPSKSADRTGILLVSASHAKQSAASKDGTEKTPGLSKITKLNPEFIVLNSTNEDDSSVKTELNIVDKPLSHSDLVPTGANQIIIPFRDPVGDLIVQPASHQSANSGRRVDDAGFEDSSVDTTSKNQTLSLISPPLHDEGSNEQGASPRLVTAQSEGDVENASRADGMRGPETNSHNLSQSISINENSKTGIEIPSQREITSPTLMNTSAVSSISPPVTNSAVPMNSNDELKPVLFEAPDNGDQYINKDDVEFFKRLIAKLQYIVDDSQEAKSAGAQDGLQPSSEAPPHGQASSPTDPQKVTDGKIDFLMTKENFATNPILGNSDGARRIYSPGRIVEVLPMRRGESPNEIAHNRIVPLMIHMKPVTYNSFYVKRELEDSAHVYHNPQVKVRPRDIKNGSVEDVPLTESSKDCGIDDQTACNTNSIGTLEEEYQHQSVMRDTINKRDSDDETQHKKVSSPEDIKTNVYFFLGDKWAETLIRNAVVSVHPPKQPPYASLPTLALPSVTSRSSNEDSPLQSAAAAKVTFQGIASQTRPFYRSEQNKNIPSFKEDLNYVESLVNFPLQNPVPPVDLNLKPKPSPDEFKLHDMPAVDMMSLGMELLPAFPLNPDDSGVNKKANNTEEPVYGVLVNQSSNFSKYNMRINMNTGHLEKETTYETHPSSSENDHYLDFVSGQFVKPYYSSVSSGPLENVHSHESGNKNYATLADTEETHHYDVLDSTGYEHRLQPILNSVPNYSSWMNQAIAPVNSGQNFLAQYSSSQYPSDGYQGNIDPRLMIPNRPLYTPYQPLDGISGPYVNAYNGNQPMGLSSTLWSRNFRAKENTEQRNINPIYGNYYSTRA